MKKPNKKELAALLQTMIILAGNRTSLRNTILSKASVKNTISIPIYWK